MPTLAKHSMVMEAVNEADNVEEDDMLITALDNEEETAQK